MKSELAKARDKWLLSDEGKQCCEGQAEGQYLKNRLEKALLAGAKFSSERIKELEKTLDSIRLTSRRSYYKPVTYVAAMDNMRIINRRCKQALKERPK